MEACLETSEIETNKIIVSEVKTYYENHKKKINEQFNVSCKNNWFKYITIHNKVIENHIQKQFQKCRKDFGHPQLVACLPQNGTKNRFKKMFPCKFNNFCLY